MCYNMKPYQLLFDTYAKDFVDKEKESKNKNLIEYKIYHTYRVRDNIMRIAASCHLDKRGMFIAEMIGLFHDIARFEQFYRFHSFNDKETFNHAVYGKEVLIKEKMLKALEPEIQDLICECVAHHGVASLPKELSSEVYYYTSMLRDADKIDILKAMADIVPLMSKEEQALWYLDRSTEEKITDKIYENFLTQKVTLVGDCKTVTDSQFARLSWIFVDMNFQESIRIIQDEKFVDTIYEMSAKDERMTQMYQYLKEKMREYAEQGRDTYLG